MTTTPISPRSPGPPGAGVAPKEGRLVGGRYTLLERLGQGGMGEVWKARREGTGAEVAVKILRAEHADEEQAAARFEREAQAAARLSHQGCVAVLDFGRDRVGMYLVMELCHGRSLADRLRAGPVPLADAARIVDGILAALDHAHALGVVHRDLKPDNVMLVPLGDDPAFGGEVVKLLDFGVARLLDAAPVPVSVSASRPATAAGMVLGTPQYLSPEQALGEPGDARADLYAVGVLLHELLTGAPPFSGTTQREVLAAHIARTPPSPSEVAPDAGIPASFDAVVARALAKSASERFQTAAEFRRQLALACEASGIRVMVAQAAAVPETGAPRGAWTEPGWASPTSRPASGRFGFARDLAARFARLAMWQRGLAAAIALAALATLVSLAASALFGDAEPRGVHVVRSAEQADLERVRDALGRGDLAGATHLAEQLVTAHPDDPRAFVQLGHALFAQRDKLRGIAAYREAVRLDRAAADSELIANLRATFADRNFGEDAFAIAEHIGPAAGLALVDFVGDTRDARLRARAQRAITTITEAASARRSGSSP
jgi:hypothetical protein